MAKPQYDEWGNKLGVRDGITTFNDRTMQEYLDAGELPAGMYVDPEGANRWRMGHFNGSLPNMGGKHSIADLEDGFIVRFHGGGGIPTASGEPGGAHPQAPYNPFAKEANLLTAEVDARRALEALIEAAKSK